MAKSHKSVYAVWLLLFVGISGILYANTSNDESFLFEMPPELRTVGGCFRDCIDPSQTGFGGQDPVPETPEDETPESEETIFDEFVSWVTGQDSVPETQEDETPVSNIICEIRTDVTGLDKNKGIVTSSESELFSKNITLRLDLTNPSNDKTIESFNMDHKIKCYLTGSIDDSGKQQLESIAVKSSKLKSTIYGKTITGVEKEIWNGETRGIKVINLTNNNEKTLSSDSANVSDIHKYLPTGDYKTTLRFQTTGDVVLINNITQNTHTITISNDKIKTEINLNVVKSQTKGESDRDGDGFPDRTDSCPDVFSITNNGCPERGSGSGGTSGGSAGGGSGDENEITDILKEFVLCIDIMDMNCLMNQKFLPMYLGGFGFIFIIGAITTRRSPVFDSFGNRM